MKRRLKYCILVRHMFVYQNQSFSFLAFFDYGLKTLYAVLSLRLFARNSVFADEQGLTSRDGWKGKKRKRST